MPFHRLLPYQSYMLTAETIEAERAREIGLLHEVVSSAADLDEWERRLRNQLGKVGVE